MIESVPAALAGWESYYVIVGSSAAALTGLQFVVMALVAEVARRPSGEQIDAFGTPSIVHFSVALLTSAMASAPWRMLASLAIALGIVGVAGLVYVAIVIRRARRQTGYRPVFEDWLWHTALPALAYAGLAAGAAWLTRREHESLFVVAAATLLLVFIGIHNAWDTVTFLTVTRLAEWREENEKPPQADGSAAPAAAPPSSPPQ